MELSKPAADPVVAVFQEVRWFIKDVLMPRRSGKEQNDDEEDFRTVVRTLMMCAAGIVEMPEGIKLRAPRGAVQGDEEKQRKTQIIEKLLPRLVVRPTVFAALPSPTRAEHDLMMELENLVLGMDDGPRIFVVDDKHNGNPEPTWHYGLTGPFKTLFEEQEHLLVDFERNGKGLKVPCREVRLILYRPAEDGTYFALAEPVPSKKPEPYNTIGGGVLCADETLRSAMVRELNEEVPKWRWDSMIDKSYKIAFHFEVFPSDLYRKQDWGPWGTYPIDDENCVCATAYIFQLVHEDFFVKSCRGYEIGKEDCVTARSPPEVKVGAHINGHRFHEIKRLNWLKLDAASGRPMARRKMEVRAEAVFSFLRYFQMSGQPEESSCRGNNTLAELALEYNVEVSCALEGSHNYKKCLRSVLQAGFQVNGPGRLWVAKLLDQMRKPTVPGKRGKIQQVSLQSCFDRLSPNSEDCRAKLIDILNMAIGESDDESWDTWEDTSITENWP
eukprot:CAMPEP_0206449998 /NCGR_PEP_ID=MMETSP0324_2-20121206/18446_1 /ASSEMBLY_ACC=CAM_ASM_000836 /TAXON_ID=2866 /ORGANISM="Crypthecodinium cohnii, Strain Seligo" /LENGTH=498 /DNA_ID=CAMNT_0053919529 /DNA_START=12 /DNA_END=1508 /DNA_ORIENTATION=-